MTLKENAGGTLEGVEVCPPMNLAQRSLESARIIHVAFLFAAIAYVVVAIYAAGHAKVEAPLAVVAGMGIAAASFLVVAEFFRVKFVQPAAEALRINAEDTAAATKWRTGTIISLVFAESIVMFGLVVRMIGSSWNISGIFYVVGILLLLAWWPKLDLTG